jgi:hypothetical protein
MAYLEGYPPRESPLGIVKHIALIAIVMVVFIGVMPGLSGNWMSKIGSLSVPLLIILALMLYVSFKVNPKGWKRVIDKKTYLEGMEQDRLIAEELRRLDDTHYIIHNFTFELFYIEFLVISPAGFFVLGKTTTGGLSIRDNILFQGGRTLETLTGNLWRVCHLINIIFKKGYQVDVMPRPVLIVPETQDPEVNTYDGMAIVRPSGLTPLIRGQKNEALTLDTVQSFAYYLKERYARKI